MLILDSNSLKAFCDALKGAPYIAVDTEFLREKSYYAKLCLIQVAYGSHAAVIDPLVADLDLSPLWTLFADTKIVKVFHAASQDLAIFFRATKRVPAPVFDTQIAASVCGYGETPGYAKLVSSLLDLEIDKSSQMTDWSVRPLTAKQLSYARGDVTHLCVVYERLLEELSRRGRVSWVAEEMAALQDVARYDVVCLDAWKRVRVRRPTRQVLGVLRALAAWREKKAQDSNTPKNWVIRDAALVEIAQSLPSSVEELARVRSVSSAVAGGRNGTAILRIVKQARDSPEESWPEIPTKPKVPDGHEPVLVLLQALLQSRCRQHEVATALVAKREELVALLRGDEVDVRCLTGWRRELFGSDALELLAGRLALTTGSDGLQDFVI